MASLAQAVPPALGVLLGALCSSPLASALLPATTAALLPHLDALAPAAAAQLGAAARLGCEKGRLVDAAARLAELSSAGGSAGTAACTAAVSEVVASLPALSLFSSPEAEALVGSLLQSCSSLAAAGEQLAGAAGLSARLLAHPAPAARLSAFRCLAEQQQQSDRTKCMAQLLTAPPVLGVLITALDDEQLQALAVHTLQQAVAADSASAGAALLAWLPWLACHSCSPAPVGPAASGLLQMALQAPGASLWHRLQAPLLGLFSSSPAVSSQAAAQLFSALAAQQGPPAVHSLEPLAGMLAPARAASGQAEGPPAPAPQGNRVAARLFSVADVEGLVQACGPSLPPEVAAQAFSQLAAVACDVRFHALLGSEQGGLACSGRSSAASGRPCPQCTHCGSCPLHCMEGCRRSKLTCPCQPLPLFTRSAGHAAALDPSPRGRGLQRAATGAGLLGPGPHFCCTRGWLAPG